MNCPIQSKAIAEELANKLNERIGFSRERYPWIEANQIHTDEEGVFYYIPSNSLMWNHPLIMAHYRGYLFVVLPEHDSVQLMLGAISVDKYIETAIWNYGFFWGGGTMLGGAHWQPLEDQRPGINNTEMVRRYLTILMCRTYERSSGFVPDADYCAKCHVECCPQSKHEKKINSSWNREVREVYDVITLSQILQRRIEEIYGLKMVGCYPHTFSQNNIILMRGYKKGTVNVYIPEALVVDMRYHPGKYNLRLIAEGFAVEVGVMPRWDPKNEVNIPCKHELIYPLCNPCKDNQVSAIEAIYAYWEKNDPYFDWFKEKKAEENMSEDSGGNKGRPANLIDKAKAACKELWKRINGQ